MTDQEIDNVLERFDQTEPQLKRRIVASMVAKNALVNEILNGLKAVIEGYLARVKEIEEFINGR